MCDIFLLREHKMQVEAINLNVSFKCAYTFSSKRCQCANDTVWIEIWPIK